METAKNYPLESRVRSPRSAAIAGLIFSVLMALQLILLPTLDSVASADVIRELMDSWSNSVRFALGSVPFSGIAFLWFTGVIRDWLGDREDRFFATVFLGSGIVFVSMLFIYAAVTGAIYGSYALASEVALDDDIAVFGHSLIGEILGNYALRIGGVYMLSIGSLLLRTGHAPRWLIILTYVLALGFLLFAGTVRAGWYAFPGWVAVVSIYILVVNYRLTGDET